MNGTQQLTSKATPTLPNTGDNPKPISVNGSHYDTADSENSVISLRSHVSTQFDNILLAHATNLRSEIDSIKMNLCTHLKLNSDEYAKITAQSIKQSNVLNKITLATNLLAIVDSAEKVCAAVSGSACRLSDSVTVNPSTPVKDPLKAIQESIKDVKCSLDQDNSRFQSINRQLEELKQSLCQMKKPLSKASTPDIVLLPPTPRFMDSSDKLFQLHSTDDTKHISSYEENFVNQELTDDLLKFFSEHSDEFRKNSENGHGVLSFGAAYDYAGAKAAAPLSREFPEPVAKLAELIKTKHDDAIINQCLVNVFPDGRSFLPKHSDNEQNIVHGSSIFTVSIGATRTVKFSKSGQPAEEKTQTVNGNSLYVMTKSSQAVWKHQIDPCEENCGLRYSITFRYITDHNKNATILVGDSNTRFIKFGNGKGTFGDRLPGKRMLAYTINQIDPSVCQGYKNVFVHCGINDIRQNKPVEMCVDELTNKLDQICSLCPSSRVTVSPILPTRLTHLNQKALKFNELLFYYVNNINSRVGSLDFNCFLDKDNLLDRKYGRYRNQSDPIHLGSTGIFTLAKLIRDKMNSPTDGRAYSAVLNAKQTKPRLLPDRFVK